MKNYPSEFYWLLHEMVSKEPFINQEINYIDEKGRMDYYNFTYYIVETLRMKSIEKHNVKYEKY